MKNSPRKIIVDIDNTLWDLAPELWEGLKKVNPALPPPSLWGHWDCWEEYVPAEELYRTLRDIHLQQEKYSPYPESQRFLLSLKERDFYIIIASHRREETLRPTVNWLKRHSLPFDEVHLSYDKSVLFDQSEAIVDDNPVILDKAAQAGMIRAGLMNPWNERTGHPLFKNLMEILDYLDTRLIPPGKNSSLSSSSEPKKNAS